MPLIINEQLAQKPFKYFAAPVISAENTNFYLTADGLVMYFQQGELAAYACGLIECHIPYRNIANLMAPDILNKLTNK